MHPAFERLDVPPGNRVILRGLDWRGFEALADEAGERRAARYAYHDGEMEIMSPHAEHEFCKSIVASLIEILLEEMDVEFIALGSVTLKNERAAQAAEPDECYYIRHETDVRGKERLDLDMDPPPDLALEIDLSSRTHFRHYAALGIPELWRYDGRELEILLLESGAYRIAEASRIFPRFDMKTLVPEIVRRCKLEGRNSTLKALRRTARNVL
jgi:Uma2 family endonuclease